MKMENAKTTLNPETDNQKKLAELSQMVEKFCIDNNVSVYMAAAIKEEKADGSDFDSVTYCNGKAGLITHAIALAMKENEQLRSMIIGLALKFLTKGRGAVILGIESSNEIN